MPLEEAIEHNKKLSLDEVTLEIDPNRFKRKVLDWWWVYIKELDAYGYIVCTCRDGSAMVYIPYEITERSHRAYLYLVSNYVLSTETI